MKIGIFTALFGDWPLEKVARHVAGLGYEAVELPASCLPIAQFGVRA